MNATQTQKRKLIVINLKSVLTGEVAGSPSHSHPILPLGPQRLCTEAPACTQMPSAEPTLLAAARG